MNPLPVWAADVLCAPGSDRALALDGSILRTPDGTQAGIVRDGIACFPIPGEDASIAFYNAVGGAHFYERASEPFAMSSLDTHVYHGFLRDWQSAREETLVVDVGAGDGRNARPWLAAGYRRVIAIDPQGDGLQRFRARVAADDPAALDRLLLIQADARALPLRPGCAGRVQAIESLYYLNEEYEAGLAECVRLLAPGGEVLLSERDYEGALLLPLLYFGGLERLLDQSRGRDVWDGTPDRQLRTRSFTPEELEAIVTAHGLRIASLRGIPILPLLIGFQRGNGKLDEAGKARLADLHVLLRELGEHGRARRCNVVLARRP